MTKNAQDWIEHLGLLPHPEGGWYRETYRSCESISKPCLPDRFSGDRNFSTAIYFLLKFGEFSAFHTIKQDEIWHFHCGNPLILHIIAPDGSYSKKRLGLDFEPHWYPQIPVQASSYFAAEVQDSRFTLMSCTVSPGFEFADFEMPERQFLIDQFPSHADLICRLTR